MKKRLVAGLTCCSILLLGAYVSVEATSSNNHEEKYEVDFKNAKLIDTQIDDKTGVKVEAYTVEGWE